jgi:hypothetical protein
MGIARYRLVFSKECPRFSKESTRLIKNVGSWYLQEDYTHLRIYGVTTSPHIIPKYVPNRLTSGETVYNTIFQGFNASLAKDENKNTFNPYNIYLANYGLVNSNKIR